MRVVLGLLALAGFFWLSTARAGDRVAAALEASDPFLVEDLLAQPGVLTGPQRALLDGAAAAMRFDDRAAIDALTRTSTMDPLPKALRRQVLSLLGSVHLRANDYAAAAEMLDAALKADDETLGEDDRLSLRQTRDVAHALRGEAPQTHDPLREGAVPIERDAANLARAAGRVNGTDQQFVLDTGAGYSTVTRSTAARLKLRLLPDAITVGSATARSVPAQLGMAESVEIAGNRFRNTVFLVMADEALSFANGAYRIDAILGFPVLARMGRIEFARAGDGETFRVAAPSMPRGTGRDLYLDGLRPIAVVEVGGAGRARLLLDTGAKRTSLNALFASTYPTLLANAATEKATFGGAGGTQTRDVRILQDVTLIADGRPRRIAGVSVSDEKKTEHGALGQDVLRAEGGFALDFNAMDFVFLPAR